MPSPATIRSYADGELTGPELAAFESAVASDADLRARVEFERSLRNRIKDNMSRLATPVGLAAQVRAAIESDDGGEVIGRIDQTTAASKPSSRIGRFFAGPTRANVFAVAACFALAAGAVLYGIFGRTIDDHSSSRDNSALQLVVESAAESSQQHGRCASSRKARDERLIWRTPDEARAGLIGLLEVQAKDIEIFDLSSLGFEFHGCGQCHMPGEMPAAQIAFVRPESADKPAIMVSFFIVPNDGQYDDAISGGMNLGEWYPSDYGDRRCHHKVLRAIDDRFVYFMVCCDDKQLQPLAQLVSQQMRMGKPSLSTKPR